MMQTIRSLKAVKFAPIVLLLAIISIAAAPAVLATPNAPTAAATSNAGEIVASWQSVAGAQFYTVGWINRNDYQQIGSSRRLAERVPLRHHPRVPHQLHGQRPEGRRRILDHHRSANDPGGW